MSAEEPRTPEQIAADYQLSVEAVKEAIAYCQSQPAEIEEDLRREEALVEAAGMNDLGYKHHAKPKSIPPEEVSRILRS
jgi:ABC-type nitrate/sulfonate/bicarbonate transport system substrate-binding protein